MAKKIEPESHVIRSALPPGQKRELKNAIRTQSEQLLILKKVRYLDGGDDNLSILTEGSDRPDRAGPTCLEPISAGGGVSERTDGQDPVDLVGSTPLKPILMEEVAMSKNAGPTEALIHYKKDGFLAMANAGRMFPDLHSNKGYIPVSFHEFKQHAKRSDLHCLIGLHKKNHDYFHTRLQNGSVNDSTLLLEGVSLQDGYLWPDCKKHVNLHKLVFTSDIFEGFSVWYVARDKGVREGRIEGSTLKYTACVLGK